MSTTVLVRRLFKQHGLSPKKWMGQNLLVDSRYLVRIAEAAAVQSGDSIVEIGAGFGALTEELAARGAKVWALEVDSGFFRVLQGRFADCEGVSLIHADALKFDFRALSAEIGSLRVVANLPYNISSRLIFLFHEHRELFSSLHVLLQKEVAERLVAPPKSKEYGVLTVLLGTSAQVDLLFDIPPRAFFPIPDVVSTLVKIEFPRNPPVSVMDGNLLIRLVKASFSGRRKTLRNTLRGQPFMGIPSDLVFRAAEQSEIDLGRRAETLSPSEFARFSNTLTIMLGQESPL